jgi:hypothetical protein
MHMLLCHGSCGAVERPKKEKLGGISESQSDSHVSEQESEKSICTWILFVGEAPFA